MHAFCEHATFIMLHFPSDLAHFSLTLVPLLLFLGDTPHKCILAYRRVFQAELSSELAPVRTVSISSNTISLVSLSRRSYGHCFWAPDEWHTLSCPSSAVGYILKLTNDTTSKPRPSADLPAYSVLWVKIRRDNRPFTFTAKNTGPLATLKIFGCLAMTILLLVSIYFRDGMGLVALLLLSLSLIMIGVDTRVQPRRIRSKRHGSYFQQADTIVIRYPIGSFIVVECDGATSEELFFTTFEVREYHSDYVQFINKILGPLVVGTGMLALSNAKREVQLIFGATYIFAFAISGIVSALPEEIHWNRSDYRTEIVGKCYNKTFTQALYKCIVATKSIGWTERSQAAPSTAAWSEWMAEALEHTENVRFSNLKPKRGQKLWASQWEDDSEVFSGAYSRPAWDPQEALSRLISEQRFG
jgi:hypothetical protein